MMVADQIKLGNIQLGIAGGAESMSNAPMLLQKCVKDTNMEAKLY